MHCNKNTQHLDLETGRWVTDPSGDSDCLEDDNEILDYCRKVSEYISVSSGLVVKQIVQLYIPVTCTTNFVNVFILDISKLVYYIDLSRI